MLSIHTGLQINIGLLLAFTREKSSSANGLSVIYILPDGRLISVNFIWPNKNMFYFAYFMNNMRYLYYSNISTHVKNNLFHSYIGNT